MWIVHALNLLVFSSQCCVPLSRLQHAQVCPAPLRWSCAGPRRLAATTASAAAQATLSELAQRRVADATHQCIPESLPSRPVAVKVWPLLQPSTLSVTHSTFMLA